MANLFCSTKLDDGKEAEEVNRGFLRRNDFLVAFGKFNSLKFLRHKFQTKYHIDLIA